MTTPTLFSHQVESIKFFSNTPIGLDASDPGTGKTRTAIELFAERRRRGEGAALIIAPKSLLRSAWEDDFAKFAPNVKVSVAFASNREKAFMREADVYVTNHDAVKWLAGKPNTFFKKFDTLIIDEISAFKHHTSQRSKALNKIKGHFTKRYGLTGTPNSNTICDVWHPMFILDNGKRLGKSFFHFRSSVCIPEQVGPQPNMLKWKDKPGAEEAVSMLMKDITIRHKFEDCLSIPENHLYSVNYHLSPVQYINYKRMEKDAIVNLQSGVVDAVNAAAVTTKLLQISSGAVYDGAAVAHTVDTGRYELVADLVEQRDHCIVFFLWEHQKKNMIKEFEARGITYVVMDGGTSDNARAEAVKLYQQGFYKVMLAHPQSAAHGLTLTRGTSTIWCSPTYNLEHFVQGNRRIYRAGQTQKTETVVVVAPGTLEDHVFKVLMDKDKKQLDLLALLEESANDSQ